MLDRFKVPEDIAIRVPPAAMHQTVVNLFMAMGMGAEDAARGAEVLIYADTRGIDSHGVSNMTRAYVAGFKAGRINPTPITKIVKDTGPAVTIDGDGGLGLVVGPPAMEIAIERARRHGLGVVIIYNAGHYGAAAYYASRALAHDMIGLSMTTGGVLVAPTHGSERLLGLNPIGIAAPSDKEIPFIFDASMSSVAGNKIALLNRIGGEVLPGWVATPDGAPMMEEGAVPNDFILLPLGGTREIGSHKGFGLMMMVEVLTSLLAGSGGGPLRRADSVHYFAAYNIDAFSDAATFKTDMDAYLRLLLDSKTAPGAIRVIYPGIEEAEAEVDRLARGIPYHPEVIDWFRMICEAEGAACLV